MGVRSMCKKGSRQNSVIAQDGSTWSLSDRAEGAVEVRCARTGGLL